MDSVFFAASRNNIPPEIRELTCREWEVLLALADDLSNAELANKLNLTEKSVQNYRNRIAGKLNLPGRNKLAWYARKQTTQLRHYYEIVVGELPPTI